LKCATKLGVSFLYTSQATKAKAKFPMKPPILSEDRGPHASPTSMEIEISIFGNVGRLRVGQNIDPLCESFNEKR
jgi:hypothetical protein